MSLAAETPHPYPDEPSFEAYAVFASLHREFYSRLVRTCARDLRDQTMAEDIAQDTMLRAMRYWTCYDTERPSWPWLKAIALRLCADAHRARTREVCFGDLPERAESADRTDAILDEITLRRAMAGLTERQRLALRLRYIDDRDRAETAELLGLNVNAFDQLLTRARVRLAHVIEPVRTRAPFGLLAFVPVRWLRALSKRGRGGLAGAAMGTMAALPLAAAPFLAMVAGVADGGADSSTQASQTFTRGLAYVRPAPAPAVAKPVVTQTAPIASGVRVDDPAVNMAAGPASARASVAPHPFSQGRIEQDHIAVVTPVTTIWVGGYTERSPGSSVVCSVPMIECSPPS